MYIEQQVHLNMLHFTKVDEQLSVILLKIPFTHYGYHKELTITPMEIHFQTTDHVVAVEIVAEQHIGTKLCSCNTFEDISHLLIIR